MKKVIVISTSLRKGSNSDMLADKFIEGATAAGHDVEKISLVGWKIRRALTPRTRLRLTPKNYLILTH